MISSVWSAHDQWSHRAHSLSLPACFRVWRNIIDHKAIVSLPFSAFEESLTHRSLFSAPIDHVEALGSELLAGCVAAPAAPVSWRLPPWPVCPAPPLPDRPGRLEAGGAPVLPHHHHPGHVLAPRPHQPPRQPLPRHHQVHPGPLEAGVWGERGEEVACVTPRPGPVLAEILRRTRSQEWWTSLYLTLQCGNCGMASLFCSVWVFLLHPNTDNEDKFIKSYPTSFCVAGTGTKVYNDGDGDHNAHSQFSLFSIFIHAAVHPTPFEFL